MGEPQPDGRRTVYFELNGQPREVAVADKSLGASAIKARAKAEPDNAKHIVAPNARIGGRGRGRGGR